MPTQTPERWRNYLAAPIGSDLQQQYRRDYGDAFAHYREVLQTLHADLRPARIACIGSGLLHDTPIEYFLRQESEVVLVDWLPKISEQGFRADLIRCQGQDHDPMCWLCTLNGPPRDYCASFGALADGHGVCSNYDPDPAAPGCCRRWLPTAKPKFVVADATLGRGTDFMRRIDRLMPEVKTPVQAFRGAIEAARLAAAAHERLPIDDGSIDLVSSSMLASQFENEPYGYFSTRLLERFDSARLEAEEANLRPLLDQLATKLFLMQMDGHARELHRLCARDSGRVFFSVELFRCESDDGRFFLAHGSTEALAILNRWFTFECNLIPPSKTLTAIRLGGGWSVVQNYLLRPTERAAPGAPPSQPRPLG